MSLSNNRLARTIWAIEHTSDNIWLLRLILEKWQYDTVVIKDRQILNQKIDHEANLPNLIIINIAPLQKNVLQLITHFRQESIFRNIPLLCLCPTGELCEFQILAAGASDVLNRPFELEELKNRLQRLWGNKINTSLSEKDSPMTLLIEETKSSSLVEQQRYWSQILDRYSKPNAWRILKEAGYEIFE